MIEFHANKRSNECGELLSFIGWYLFNNLDISITESSNLLQLILIAYSFYCHLYLIEKHLYV